VEEVEEVEQSVEVEEGARKQQRRRVKEEWVWDSSSLSMLAWTCAIGVTGAASSLSLSLSLSLLRNSCNTRRLFKTAALTSRVRPHTLVAQGLIH
jgi:hypothetical protein